MSETEYSSDEDVPATGPHPSYLRIASDRGRDEASANVVVPQRSGGHHNLVSITARTSLRRMAKAIGRSGHANKVRRPVYNRDSPAEARWRRKAVADGEIPFPHWIRAASDML